MPICSNGHESDMTDYCSTCGVVMSPSGAPEAADPAAVSEPAAAAPEPHVEAPSSAPPAAANGPSCPNCSSSRSEDDVFCENCGFDFLTGTAPEAAPTTSSPSPTSSPDVGTTGPGMSSPAAEKQSFVAVVTCDRGYFDLTAGDSELSYPDPEPDPVRIPLSGELLIGRYSETRGVYPEIDSLATSGDPAVSSRHAIIRIKPDGSAILLDVGSTNGTFLDDDTDPIAQGVEMAVIAGSIVRVGAWTRITVESA